jgi:hypothetical protein
VRGVRGDDLAKLARRQQYQGRFARGFDAEGVAIGRRMAKNLGLVLGDTITLISPDGDITPMGDPRGQGLSGRRRSSRSACRNMTRPIIYMPLGRGAALFQF